MIATTENTLQRTELTPGRPADPTTSVGSRSGTDTSTPDAIANISRLQGTVRATAEREKPFLAKRLIAGLLLAAPAAWIGTLIFIYGVDTPWGDQWDGILPLFQKMHAGTLRLSDFFAFHNEHRIVFPRLVTLQLAKLTHWNVRAELLVIWVLICISALNFSRLAQITGWRSSRSRDWLLLGTNLMLFSPVQWENLLWGFQIGFLLPIACLTTSAWVARSPRNAVAFLGTICLCLISTFSIASGFCCWLLTAPLLFLYKNKPQPRRHSAWTYAWIIVAVASVFLYFHGYERPAIHPSATEVLKHPFRAIEFYLAYLGNVFSSGTALDPIAVATIAGTAVFLTFSVCVFYIWRWRRDDVLLTRSLPWLSVAGWAVANAILTTAGRLGLGMSTAVLSRYVSFGIMLPIALLFLVSLVFAHCRQRSPTKLPDRHMGWCLVSLTTALSVLFLCASISSLDNWKRFQHGRLSGKAALLLINVVDDPRILSDYVHGGDPALKTRVNFLDQGGFLRPGLVRSSHIRHMAYRSAGDLGEFRYLGKTSSAEFTASGWAILSGKQRVADMVLLTYDDAKGEPSIFALADVRYATPDVSQRLDDHTYDHCGWVKSWKANQLPPDAGLIRAWAFDAESCRAFWIGNAPKPES